MYCIYILILVRQRMMQLDMISNISIVIVIGLRLNVIIYGLSFSQTILVNFCLSQHSSDSPASSEMPAVAAASAGASKLTSTPRFS